MPTVALNAQRSPQSRLEFGHADQPTCSYRSQARYVCSPGEAWLAYPWPPTAHQLVAANWYAP
jgi:hypothetical protein